MPGRPAILYISYDGMLEPLGQSQVLAYLEPLAAEFSVHLLSFEKPDDLARVDVLASVRRRIEGAGIGWTHLRYHKSPSAPATAFDILAGTLAALRLARHGVQTVHARSYVAALIGLGVKRATGARLLFDMRGLWADERVDGGLWPKNGRLYRTAKAIEKKLLAGADHIVTLTDASVGEIGRLAGMATSNAAISVIPTCTDLARFSPPSAVPSQQNFTLGHVGSVGTWYLLDEMLRCFIELRLAHEGAKLLIVNRGEQDAIRDRLSALNVDERNVEIVGAEHAQVPALIGRMHAGMAIIKPVYSKTASAPTKIGEYLGCGVPVLGNAGVGDVEAILEGGRVGVALKSFEAAEIRSGVGRIVALARDPDTSARCQALASDIFSLQRGVDAYRNIYNRLAASRG